MEQTKMSDGLLFEKLRQVINEMSIIQDPLIEILREAQEIFGYIPVEVEEFIASELNISLGEVHGVVTFYNFFSTTPRGKYLINVCTGTACYVKGASRLIQILEEELKIQLGETTPDGLFTLSSVRCVGACSLAPVFMIDDETFGRIDTKEKIKKILIDYK